MHWNVLMSHPRTDGEILFDTGFYSRIWAVVFSLDGECLLSGSKDGIRRFRLADKVETAKQTGMDMNAISISKDGQRIICGAEEGASVWDVELQEKICEVEDGRQVRAVDVSPDSTRFATGTNEMSVWDISTGERLLGPAEFKSVNGIRFSPDGERIAISEWGGPITIVDSQSGEQLVTIQTETVNAVPATPLAWTNDGQQLLAVCMNSKAKSFDASTGSLLAESQAIESHYLRSIAVSDNGRFIVTFADDSVIFLDTSSLTQVGLVIKEDNRIRSIALTSDSTYLARVATGQRDGKILVRDLTAAIPDIFGVHTPLGSDENKSHDSDVVSSHHDSGPDNRDDDIDLLEVEVPSSAPPPVFNYSKPPSPTSSVHPRVDEAPTPPVEVPCAISPSPRSPPEPFFSELHSEEHPETTSPSKVHSSIRGWLKKWAGQRSDDRSGEPLSSTGTMAALRHPQVHVLPSADYSEGIRQHAPLEPPPPNPLPVTAKYFTRQRGSALAQSFDDPSPPLRSGTTVVLETNHARQDRMAIKFSLPTWLVCFRPCSVDEAD
ncbi:hypothetical protein JVU11DRAFT_9698 [Chiua virens]|nr:hypothetical protein JVU11DRAFT_9698 [Chiua virens]